MSLPMSLESLTLSLKDLAVDLDLLRLYCEYQVNVDRAISHLERCLPQLDNVDREEARELIEQVQNDTALGYAVLELVMEDLHSRLIRIVGELEKHSGDGREEALTEVFGFAKFTNKFPAVVGTARHESNGKSQQAGD